jgi:hypothetical protein
VRQSEKLVDEAERLPRLADGTIRIGHRGPAYQVPIL